jgi:hypothetical protein
MAIFRNLYISVVYVLDNQDSGRLSFFPANRIDIAWLFQQFSFIKNVKTVDDVYNTLRVDKQVHMVLAALLTYLEDNGWECFAVDGGEMCFKRLDETD